MEIEWHLRIVRNGRLRRQSPNGEWTPIGSIEVALTLGGLAALALIDSDEASLKASLILRRTQNRDGNRPPIPRVAIRRPDAYSTKLEDIQMEGLWLFRLDVENKSVPLKPNMVDYSAHTAINSRPSWVGAPAGFALSMKNLSGNSILGIRATAPIHFVIADAICSRSVGFTPRHAFHHRQGTEFIGNLAADPIHHVAELQPGVSHLAPLSDPITRLADLRMEKNND